MSPGPEGLDSLLPLAGDPPALQALTETVNVDLLFERQISTARRRILDAHACRDPRLDALRPLAIALAHQAFNNEYVVAVPAAEMARVPAPEQMLGEASPVSMPEFEWAVILAAMYRPLLSSIIDGRQAVPIERFASDMRPLVQRALVEPATEAAIAASIASLGDPADETSTAVRAVYERHPYPRWFQVTVSGKSIREEMRRFGTGAVTVSTPSRPQILVAGCGTGHHAIRVALDNPAADVVGLDFSRAALAYGVRMAAELGVRNVTFVHGDLLNADRLGRLFDHIECSGVLHHVRAHDAAWSRMCDILAPAGTMKIGLYSRVARLHIEHVRGIFTVESGADAAMIQTLRARLLDDSSLTTIVAGLARHRDFFTTSTIRDLLFHVYERPLFIAEVEAIVARCGLELLGVDAPREIRSAVDAREANAEWPVTSFKRWKEIEWAYAGTSAMFRFWLRKPTRRIAWPAIEH